MKTRLLFLFVFLSTAIFSQIIFVDNFDGACPHTESVDTWYFDIDSDGQDDVRFTQHGSQPYNAFFGITEDLGPNRVQATDEMYQYTVDCTDETINAFTSVWNEMALTWSPEYEFDIGLGNFKQAVRVIALNPANNQAGYLYGYIDYSKLQSQDVIIHGWYYESSFNQEIVVGEDPTLDLLEINTSREIVQILDLLGRETKYKPNKTLIFVYDDGSTEKVFTVE